MFLKNNSMQSHRVLIRFFVIFFSGLSVSLMGTGSLVAGTSSQTLSSVGQPVAESQVAVDGYLSMRYVYRSATYLDSTTHIDRTVSDQDLFGELRFDMRMPKTNRFEFHFLGTLRSDLDGNSDLTGFYPLEDIGNTYRTDTHGYLYDAHLGINDPLPFLTQVRIGRQEGLRDEPAFFDGLATDIRMSRLVNLTLYGGAAVRFYDTDTHWGDDTLAGAGLDVTPAPYTKLSVDYLTIKEKSALSPAIDQQDKMVSLRLWQSIASFLKASVKYRYLNSDPRDLNIRVVATIAPADMDLNFNYFRQFNKENELANELSHYYDVLGQSSPYQSYDVKLRKLLGAHYAIDLGYFKRELLEESQTSSFDRDFSRTFILFEVMDLPGDGISFTLTGERWYTKGRDYNSSGLDMGYRFKNMKNASVNVGTYYSLYKYDYYNELGLRQNVHTYYVNGKMPLGKGVSINSSYEYEDSIEKYQTFKLGMRYDF
jgi:hypothetical protein